MTKRLAKQFLHGAPVTDQPRMSVSDELQLYTFIPCNVLSVFPRYPTVSSLARQSFRESKAAWPFIA